MLWQLKEAMCGNLDWQLDLIDYNHHSSGDTMIRYKCVESRNEKSVVCFYC